VGKHILIVDDDPGICRLLQISLEQYGCTVDIARNGGEALTKLDHTSYDGVILDFAMPGGIDGLTVLRHIRSRRASLPVVMMSGYSSKEIQVPALAAGAQTCLLKPFSIVELEHAVEHWFQIAA
jgi:DNA-binding response OmpR family regulator